MDSFEKQQGYTMKFWSAMVALFFVFLFLTFWVWSVVDSLVNDEQGDRFLGLVEEATLGVERSLGEYISALYGARGLFSASDEVERREWQDYVEALNVESRLPGVMSFQYIEVVDRENLDVFERGIANDTSLDPEGYAGFEVFPKEVADKYFVVKYVEPMEENRGSFGFDMGSNRSRLNALKKAIDANRDIVTEPIFLVDKGETKTGFMALLPVYENGVDVSSVELRRENVAGFVSMVFSAEEFFESLLSKLPEVRGLDVKIEDIYSVDDTVGSLLFLDEEVPGNFDREGVVLENRVVSVGARIWRLSFLSTSALTVSSAARFLPSTVLITGVILSVIIVLLVFYITTGRQRAILRATMLTKDISSQRDRVKTILENIGEGVFAVNPSGTILIFNEAAEILTGKKAAEVVGKNYLTVFRSLETESGGESRLESLINKAFKAELRDGAAGRIILLDSAVGQRPISFKISSIVDVTGFVTNAVVVFRDATQEKEVEEARNQLKAKVGELEKTKLATMNVLSDVKAEKERFEKQVIETQKFQQAVESSTDGVVITNANAEVLYANNSWQRINQYSLEEMRGKNLRFVKSGKTPSSVFAEMWKTLTAGRSFVTEDVINKRKDGSEYNAHLAISPILENGKVTYYVGLVQDITDRKRVERAKTEFVSLAAHQLRTPLSAIRWYAELLVSGDAGEMTEEQKEYLMQLQESNLRMIDLVDDFLNVSRLDLGTFEVVPKPMDLRAVVDSLESELKPEIERKKLEFVKDYQENLPMIDVDEKLIRVVIQNFMTNAIKYTPEAGRVVVKLFSDAQNMQIAVSDTGYGIPEKDKSRIFSKLFRAANVISKEVDGNGLGLYVVKQIVETSGGKVWFESKEGEGSTFFVTLPLAGMKPRQGNKTLIS